MPQEGVATTITTTTAPATGHRPAVITSSTERALRGIEQSKRAAKRAVWADARKKMDGAPPSAAAPTTPCDDDSRDCMQDDDDDAPQPEARSAPPAAATGPSPGATSAVAATRATLQAVGTGLRFLGGVMHSVTHAVGWTVAAVAPSAVTRHPHVRAAGAFVAASVESTTAIVDASAAATREVAQERAAAAELVTLHQTGSTEAAVHARESASIAVDVADVGHQMAHAVTPHGAAVFASAHEHIERGDLHHERRRQSHQHTGTPTPQPSTGNRRAPKRTKRLPQVYVVSDA